MNKSDLIDAMAADAGISKVAAKAALEKWDLRSERWDEVWVVGWIFNYSIINVHFIYVFIEKNVLTFYVTSLIYGPEAIFYLFHELCMRWRLFPEKQGAQINDQRRKCRSLWNNTDTKCNHLSAYENKPILSHQVYFRSFYRA